MRDALRRLLFKLLKARTRDFGFTDICKHYVKFQLFKMYGSQDIVQVSIHQISFKLKCF